jgi:fido (protein-threonine AMPylation protein)
MPTNDEIIKKYGITLKNRGMNQELISMLNEARADEREQFKDAIIKQSFIPIQIDNIRKSERQKCIEELKELHKELFDKAYNIKSVNGSYQERREGESANNALWGIKEAIAKLEEGL